MEDSLKFIVFFCLVFWGRVFAAPTQQDHDSGGEEHIVIIDKSHPTPPLVADVLNRLSLNESHPDVRHVYNNSAFFGFAASMKSHCLDLLANMSDISVVEKTSKVASASVSAAPYSLSHQTRPDAPWGLQRISTSSSVDGDAGSLDYTYSYSNSDLGEGVDVYIVDTGLYTKHNVFNGRASIAWAYDNGTGSDEDGHGTHVSGTATGDILGVASKANVFGVKVLDNDGGGWSSNVIAGIDQVIKLHDARVKQNLPDFKGSVMSMSLASGVVVSAMDSAVRAAVDAGVHVCVAAGNSATDACSDSPASSGGTRGPAITVGSVDMQAKRSSFSNYGDCVDVYAPGEGVVSSWIGQPNMINMLSGTSMATPHVTGIVAYAMGNRTLAQSPALMKEWIQMMALPVDNGLLLANNGVQTKSSPTSAGYANTRRAARSDFVSAGETRPVRHVS